jgi:putative lipoic acid-binding regulatory protein
MPRRTGVIAMMKEISYPAEITFKSIFINRPDLALLIDELLAERGLSARVTRRTSRNKRFISYTITAEIGSESHLDDLCRRIAALDGFIMMI